MAEALRRISEWIADAAAEAGFELIDQQLSGGGPWWLDYGRLEPEGPILLSLSQAPERRLLVAELWQPAQLPEARRLMHAYRAESDQATAILEISREVAGWLREDSEQGSDTGSIRFPFPSLLA